MCGIAGILRFDGASAEPRQARQMARLLEHRGPDGEGFHASGPVALAHRRLAIIDLSDRAAQPMSNEDSSLWLVCNGEIYNYVEVRLHLQSRGHTFRSGSDNEVILHAYEEEGTECTTRFNGMWAFALWDTREQRLILSRDRLGEKPLYYTVDSRGVIFASEVKALLVLRPDLAEPSVPELAQFLSAGFMETGSDTFFRRILQVPPGHTATIRTSGRIDLKRFWAPPSAGEAEPMSALQAARGIRDLLEDSVRLRLRSDVPLGTCLSGGLDSSCLVAIESRHLHPQPVHTFSSIFEEDGYNERPYIEAVNAAFRTVAHQTTPPLDSLALLPRLVWHQETPLPGPGVYPQWCVMALAKGKVKVLLDGQGADELLGGYFYYYADHLADLLGRLWRPEVLWSFISALVRIRRRVPLEETARLLRGAVRRLRGIRRPAGFQGGWHQEYLSPDLAIEAKEFLDPAPEGCPSFLEDALFGELTRTSIPKLLHYEDRNSMAHGIETRVPFLDHRLVEFCFRMPGNLRIDSGVTKAPLRRAMNAELPTLVAQRIDKKGFPEPLARWIREEGFEPVADLLLSRRTRSRGIFRIDRIEKALAEHRAGADRTVPLYRALTLELWFRLFPDREGAALFAPDSSGELGVNSPGVIPKEGPL